MWQVAPQALKRLSRRQVVRQMMTNYKLVRRLPKKERDIFLKTAQDLVAVIPRDLSIEKKVTLLYLTLTSQITYDKDCGSMEDPKNIRPYLFITPLRMQRGVCMGIAELFTYLCILLDIKALTVVGYAAESQLDAEENGTLHAWNMVRLDDGRYYHLDLTWDLHKPSPGWQPQWLFKAEAEMHHHYWILEDYPRARKSFPGTPYFSQKGVDLLCMHWRNLTSV